MSVVKGPPEEEAAFPLQLPSHLLVIQMPGCLTLYVWFAPTCNQSSDYILFDKCSESTDPVPGTALSPSQILTHSGLHNNLVKKVPSLATLPQEETQPLCI